MQLLIVTCLTILAVTHADVSHLTTNKYLPPQQPAAPSETAPETVYIQNDKYLPPLQQDEPQAENAPEDQNPEASIVPTVNEPEQLQQIDAQIDNTESTDTSSTFATNPSSSSQQTGDNDENSYYGTFYPIPGAPVSSGVHVILPEQNQPTFVQLTPVYPQSLYPGIVSNGPAPAGAIPIISANIPLDPNRVYSNLQPQYVQPQYVQQQYVQPQAQIIGFAPAPQIASDTQYGTNGGYVYEKPQSQSEN